MTSSQPRYHFEICHLRACLLLVALLMLGGCRATLFAGLNSTDQHRGIKQRRNIVFDAAHDLDLDVYLPEHQPPSSSGSLPIVVFFYGGDWTHGKRQWYRFVGTSLAAQGVITVIPDYRKYPQVKMEGFMQAGFIGLAGVYDFVPIPAFEKDMLGTFGHQPAEQRLAEPVAFVSGHEPPMLLLQGTADHEVDPSNAVSLDKAMQAEHEDVTLKLYPGVSHSPLLFAMSRPLRGHAPTLADILRFIRSHQSASDQHSH